MNFDPCSVFVEESAIISSVGKYSMAASLDLTLSVIKKYHIFI